MDNQIKELIAIGASISANCGPCLEYHVAKAREYGANDRQIREAVGVGKAVRNGATEKMDRATTEIVTGVAATPSEADNPCCLKDRGTGACE